MRFEHRIKIVRNVLLIAMLLFISATVGLFYGYQRGYDHGEKITNKWWIDQQSQYYDTAEVAKKRRTQNLDTI